MNLNPSNLGANFSFSADASEPQPLLEPDSETKP